MDILLLHMEDTMKDAADVGVAYVEPVAEWAVWARDTIDFRVIKAFQCRIVCMCNGNEAGAGKGVCIYNMTDGVVLCEVTWDGVDAITQRVGAWTALNLNKEIVVGVYCKGSSATEDLQVGNTHFQILVEN
jgi:hypothetical protein